MRTALLLPVLAVQLAAAAPQDLLGDPAYRRTVQQLFQDQKQATGGRAALFDVFKLPLSAQEHDALTFLVAGSPLCDLGDVEGAFLLKEVEATFEARRQAPWSAQVPVDLFRHFVLPLRVNNEPLDAFRSTHFQELLGRVKGLSMTAAALEINHWCQERVTYQGSDARTSSPLATLRTAWGRCGEESTFTVAALRAVGIPARQVYTPRWAHSDDNHAWVEVWVDGKWRFLGACEPEPDLDMGWFKEPARRAMLIHARAFGPYRGTEPILVHTPRYAELNLTAHYAPVRPLTVTVQDAQGRPVSGATVDFRLFNYAEFYPLVARETDAKGSTRVDLGLGDLLVWARKGNAFGYQRVSVDRQDRVVVKLTGDARKATTLDFDQVPPVERPALPVSAKAKAECDARVKAGSERRKAYTDTFLDAVRATAALAPLGVAGTEADLLVKAQGNHAEILTFLKSVSAKDRPMALALLRTVSDKDLRDTPATVLIHHLQGAQAAAGDLATHDPAAFQAWVLNPRVDVEFLTTWRQDLPKALPAAARKDGHALAAWMKTALKVQDGRNPWRLPMSPRAVLELRLADSRSRDIAFVAAARSLGWPARLHPELRTPQFLEGGRWIEAALSPRAPEGPKAQVRFTGDLALKVGNHASLARFEAGRYVTLDLPEGKALKDLPSPLEVPAGAYLAVTGSRQTDGSVLARLSFLPLAPGATVELPMTARSTAEPAPVLARLDRALVGGTGPRILAWLAPGQEPTRHVMNDLRDLRLELEKAGTPLELIIPTGDPGPDFKVLPGTATLTHDPDQKRLKEVAKALGRPVGNRLPLLLLVDTNGQVRFLHEGYRLGLGEQVLRTLRRM